MIIHGVSTRKEGAKVMKKVLAALLTLAMIVTGFLYLSPEASEVEAATTATGNYEVVEKAECDTYETDEKGVPQKEGYLFAGYFKSEVCTLENWATKNNATHAKFVKDDMLDVKIQVTNGVVQSSDVVDKDGNKIYEGKYVIRFVSSVESKAYTNIGFEVQYEDADGNIKTARNTTTSVFKRIDSTTGAVSGEVDTYDFSPKLVGTDSEYFTTAKLPVAVGDEDVTYTVRAFWTTVDGTEVMGDARCVSVNDAKSNVVNMAVQATAQLDGTYTATYGPNADGTGATATKVEVLSSDANGYSNVRITLADGDSVSALKSATKFVIKDSQGTEVATSVYRNYYTDVAGTADTSWWDVDSTATEFTIASVSDLYGLASIVNGKKDLFYQDEIQLVRSVTVNEGLAIRASEASDGVATWKSDTTPVAWTPIGSGWNADFRGIFNGDNNTISGLYISGSSSFVGLFGYVGINNGQNAEIENIRLTNSYFESSYDYLGSIVSYGYGLGRVENVYSDAIVVSTKDGAYAGGLVGRMNLPDRAIKDDSGNKLETLAPTLVYKNCWFDGEVNATSSGANRTGGIMSTINNTYRLEMTNCLYTGVINSESSSAVVGGLSSGNINASWMELTNCLSVGEINATSDQQGGLFARFQAASTGWLELDNCYTTEETAWYVNEFSDYTEADCKKTVAELAATDADTLFSGHNGAWVNDVEDDQTPILSSFATWWADKQYEAGLDTSWYNDEDTEFIITTASQLNGLAELAKTDNFSGKTIKLGADIALNEADSAIVKKWRNGTAVAGNMWTPIGTSDSKFAGTFDGQGYTISGLYLDSTEVGAALFGYTDTTAVLKDFKVVDSYIKSTRDAAAGVVGYGSFESMESVYSNAVIESDGQKIGGLVGIIVPRGESQNTTANITFKNCWFDGDVVAASANIGGFIGSDETATGIQFINCLSTGSVEGDYKVGGFYGWKNNYAVSWFYNCLSVAATTVRSETYATYYGSYFGDHNTSTYNTKMSNTYGLEKMIGHYSSGSAFETTDYIKTRDELIQADETTIFPALTDQGETNNAWVSDSATGWNNTDRGTPVLSYFAEWWLARGGQDELTVDFSWYNDTDTEFILYDAGDLGGLAYIANNTDDFTGKVVKLGADIELNEVDADILASWKAGTVVPGNPWTPIGTSEKPFNGTFDGQGYEISGLYLSATTEGAGLFGYTGVASEFKNFKFVDSYMTSTAASLGLIGVGKFVNIENIYTNAYIVANDNNVGGFVGTIYNIKSDYAAIYSTFKNCWFDGTITQTNGAKYATGGFVGGTAGAASLGFYNCLSTGTLSGGFRVGGFYGWKNYYALFETRNCLSVADVSTSVATGYEDYTNYYGAFYGDYSSSRWNAKMYNSYGLEKINGGTGTEFETTDYIKTRTELINTDEATLFPVLTGYGDVDTNAWVNDIGYNNVDRGTPILASFAEWWLARQPETELAARPDTSWYTTTDEGAEFVLDTAEELYGFALLGQTNTFAGQTIKLGANIALNKADADIIATWKDGTVTPAGQWTPVGTSTNAFAGTFDGQGYEISGLYLNATTDGAGLFGTTAATAVIKNFKLVDSYMASTANKLGIVGTGTFANMESIYTNAVMVSSGNDVAGFAGTVATNGGTVTFNNCWFDGEIIHTGEYLAGGFVGEDSGATAIAFNNCLSTGSITGTSKVGGFMGWANNYAVKTFNNCLSIADVEATGSPTYCGTYFGQINTSPYNFTVTNTYGVGLRFNGVYGSSYASYETQYESATYIKTRDEICGADVATLFAGSDAWVNDNENGWNDTDRGTPILATFAEWWIARQPEPTYTVDLSWYNTDDNTFTLYDVADVRGFVAIANNKDDFTGKTVKLGADIVLNTPNVSAWKEGTAAADFKWTPIGTSEKPFAGIFDGQGYTISGLYLKTNVEGAGLFGYSANTSEFRNFKLVDSYMENSAPSLGIVGRGAVVCMENIYTNAVMISTASDRSDVSGFLGTMDRVNASDYVAVYTSFTNCWFDGYVQNASSGRKAGGFLGGMGGAASVGFYNCLSTGTVTGGYNLGGFFGAKDNYATCEIRDCLSVANVSANPTNTSYADYYGSFFGDHSTSAYNSKMYTSYGLIKIVGYGNNPATGTVMERSELIDTDVTMLFPESNAWRNDVGYNDTDRGTPILEYFADWWLGRHQATGLLSRPDISWYTTTDEGATFTLTTAEQLYGLAQLARTNTFAGQTIKLGNDIVLNEVDATILAKWKAGSAIPDKEWTSIGTSSTPFAGTFDGQGYAISGLYQNATTEVAGLFGNVAYDAEVLNLKFIDSYIKGAGKVGLIGEGLISKVENVYSNAIMESTANNVGGILGHYTGYYTDKTVGESEAWAQGIMTFNNCWFDGEINMKDAAYVAGGIVGGQSARSRVDMTNCLYTGHITSERADNERLGGFFGWANSTAQYNFTNCLSVGSFASTNMLFVGGFIGDVGNNTVTFTNCYTTYDGTTNVGIGNVASGYSVTYVDSAVMTRDELFLADEATLFPTLDGETENAWVSDTAYNTTDRGTPILSYFADWWLGLQPEEGVDDVPDTAWYTANPDAAEFVINDRGDLLGFAVLANNTTDFAGKTVKLGANITLNEADVATWAAGTAVPDYKWSPVGTADKPFAGTFDGQGHSIIGAYVKSSDTYVGFFGLTAGASAIQNLRLVDSYIEKTTTTNAWGQYTGAVAAVHSGNVSNVYSNATIVSACNYVGGIVGEVRPAQNTDGKLTISDCWFDGTIKLADGVGYTGGIVGHQPDGKLCFKNVLYTGHIKANRTDSGNVGIGGILGRNEAAVSGAEFESVVSSGSFDIPNGTKMIGSVVGYLYSGADSENTADYVLSNVFANREWGTASTWGGGNGTLTGQVIQTADNDRFIGYIPQIARDITNNTVLAEQKLDFTTTSGWTMRTNDVPVPTALKDMVDVRYIVSDTTAATLTSKVGLGTLSSSISSAVAQGAGDYVVTLSGDKTAYDNYLAQLGSADLGFTKYVDNATATMATDGIYTATYVKEATDGEGEFAVTATFVANTSEIFVVINTDTASLAKTLVDNDETNPIGAEDGTNAVSLSMLEDHEGYTDSEGTLTPLNITGNCFVFQLPNGHFIINDGNTDGGSGAILKAYLQSQVGEGNPIYIDAWTISHFHNDHAGALMDMASDATLRENVYLNALYVNEPSAYGATIYETRTVGDINTAIQGAKRLTKSPTDTSAPDVYQVHMGERYYFNGITMDIVSTPDQLAVDSWNGGTSSETTHIPDPFNTSSINFVFTVQGNDDDTTNDKKVLLGGDTTMVTMKYIMSAYGSDSNGYGTSTTLADINVFAAYHHGKNFMTTWDPGHNSNHERYDAIGNNGWADYLLGASGKLDVMLFPNYEVFETTLDASQQCSASLHGGSTTCAGTYVGDDGSIVYAYNAGELNQYYIGKSDLYFTTGYEDMIDGATADNYHGTVKITFNANGEISYIVYGTVHGKETYTFEAFEGTNASGTITPDTAL